MVPGHSCTRYFPQFIEQIKIDFQFFAILWFVEHCGFEASESNSTGMIASIQNVKLKGVSLVRVLAVVLYAHKTLGNLSIQAPFALSSRALIILSKVRFVTSTYLLD